VWASLGLLVVSGRAAAADAELAERVRAAMDTTADPCVDFYQYACGGWVRETTLPGDQSRWVRSFSVIDEQNVDRQRALLDAVAKDPMASGDARRIGDFYGVCMDEAGVEKAATTPLAPWLAAIGRVDGAKAALGVAGRLQRFGNGALLQLQIAPDLKNPGIVIAYLGQGGLGMPDRDYYVSTDPKKQELMAAYERHVARMLGLLGEDSAKAKAHARDVVAFETALAKASREATEMRLPEKLYNKLDIAGLKGLTPKLDWDGFLAGLGRPGLREINVETPEFFEALEKELLAARPETLQAYLRWSLVNQTAGLLPAAFQQADFDFYQATFQGQKEMRPRWKRCVDATETALGEALGKLYVEKYFPGESRQIAVTMMKDIQDAFVADLPGLRWMDDATRQRAREKKEALESKIGYPVRFRDYSKLTVGKTSYFANTIAANEFESDRQLAKIGKAPDRSEWGMTPQTVNAGYNPLNNMITFPAGILQPPFFSRDFPAPMNYGAVGTVMGHELTHGFDDEGRKFDAKGELREWWAPEVTKAFEEQAQCVRDQYDAYEVEPGVHVNGTLTAGENIGDVGGMKQAWLAYKAWSKRNGGDGPGLAGFTPDQLFFLGHAQSWCTVTTPEDMRRRVAVDVHSPSKARVIGPIVDHPAFGAAFECKAGTPMNPVKKCEVW
jgi:predicted metalloendopeptidase